MSTPLKKYLARLATDPAFFEMHSRDREAAMKEAGLSERDCAALDSRDVTVIVARLEESGPAAPGSKTESSAEVLIERFPASSPTVAVLVSGFPTTVTMPAPTLGIGTGTSGGPKQPPPVTHYRLCPARPGDATGPRPREWSLGDPHGAAWLSRWLIR